jgi:hypothetical protein
MFAVNQSFVWFSFCLALIFVSFLMIPPSNGLLINAGEGVENISYKARIKEK